MKNVFSISLVSLSIAVSSCANTSSVDSVDQINQSQVESGGNCSQILNSKDIVSQSKPGVVTLLSDKSQGTGFVASNRSGYSYILTNQHVVEGGNKVAIIWSDGAEDVGDVILAGDAKSTLGDIAVVRVKGSDKTVLKLQQETPSEGTNVIAIGSPKGLQFSASRGIISAIRASGRLLQTDAAINPGNSGGPLLSEAGCVVGMNTFKLQNAESLNFAISSQLIGDFISSIISDDDILDSNAANPKAILASTLPAPVKVNSFSDQVISEKVIKNLLDIQSIMAEGKENYSSLMLSEYAGEVLVSDMEENFRQLRSEGLALIKNVEIKTIDITSATPTRIEAVANLQYADKTFNSSGKLVAETPAGLLPVVYILRSVNGYWVASGYLPG